MSAVAAESDLATLAALRDAMRQFVAERGWERFHTPRNLLLALTGEVGELAEIFRWEGELAAGLPGFKPEKLCVLRRARGERKPSTVVAAPNRPLTHPPRHHLGEELADVLLFLVRMSDVCGVDLARAAALKMARNRRNYPADKCFGSSAKYTAYKAEGSGAGSEEGSVSSSASGGGVGGGGDGSGGGSGARSGSRALEVPVWALGFLAPLVLVGAWSLVAALRRTRA
jgi:dCTP diphosphatase